ncbi:unnamed protein product, partial [Adineta steineri]
MLISSNRKYICICPKGFSENRCEKRDTEIDLIFDKDIQLSHSIFIHFITIIPYDELQQVIPPISPQRLTTLQTISQATNTIRIFWSQPFHLTFIETFEKIYYLSVIQPIYKFSIKIIQRINSSHRCPSINELMNKTFAQLHVLHRIKSYHFICQKYSPNLLCFHDDIHLCLCDDFHRKRLANC